MHMGLNVTITAAFIINFLWRQASYSASAPVELGPLTLSVLSIAALGVSGFLGGKLAYRFGVRVAGEADQADGFRPSSPS